ncbi:hypothetical protein JW964_18445 [candidate division KSB1 bacterium]|nr:hypothetical protein [candidate division KSB1 bacterium]
MTCKEFQKILMDQDEFSAKKEDDPNLIGHLQDCPVCQKFANNLKEIRLKIHGLKQVAPGSYLFETTLNRCHQELDQLNPAITVARSNAEFSKIPGYIWILLPLTIILSVLWIFPEMQQLIFNQNLTWASIVILFILFENFLMLILTPVLLRWQKSHLNLQMSLTHYY